MSFIDGLTIPAWDGVLEIFVIAAGFYYLFLFIHGTRGAQVLTGLVLLFVTLIVLTSIFRLETLSWILQRSPLYLAFAVVVIFQPEIRRVLAELGRRHYFSSGKSDLSYVDTIVNTATLLADQKIGALIAVERAVSTTAYQETGTPLDAVVSTELLSSLFYPRTPLHDGGVILRDNRIVAAGCVFPLTQREGLGKSLGTRHRAAIGLTEETDAVVVVVSEETGAISIAYKGRLRRGLEQERLSRALHSLLNPERLKDVQEKAKGQFFAFPRSRKEELPGGETKAGEHGVG